MARKKKGRSSFGSVIKVGESFGYRLRRGSLDLRKMTGPDRDVAEAALADALLRVAKEEHLGVKAVGRVSFKEFQPSFERFMHGRVGEETLATMLLHYGTMGERVGKEILSDFTPQTVEGIVTWLKNTRSVKPATCNRYLATLSAVFRAAIAEGFAKENPTAGVRRAKEELRAIPYVSMEDLRRLEAVAPTPDRWALGLAGETGLRRGEIRALEWRDVDLGRGVLVVRRSKSKKWREVPLTRHAREVIEAALADRGGVPLVGGDPVFPWFGPESSDLRVSRAIAGWCAKAGLPTLRFHDLRHGWASRLMRAGVDPATIMRLGGWATLAMVQRYATHAPDDAGTRAIEALERAEAKAPRKEAV